MTQQITELCLITDAGVVPFAVLVEQDGRCAWATGADFGARLHTAWAGHVLASKDRRPREWWVLAAWRDWLAGVAREAPERRRKILEQVERSTPGICIRRPIGARTRLPFGALATRWRRDRLHDRAEVIGGEIAARLEGLGSVHWSAEVVINEHHRVVGDWVVAIQSVPDDTEPGTAFAGLRDLEPTRITGVLVIRVVEANEIDAVKVAWMQSREALGSDHPFGIAVVRHTRQAEWTKTGCLVGDRFPAAVTLAVAVARAYRRRD